jgi:hypothetical protein
MQQQRQNTTRTAAAEEVLGPSAVRTRCEQLCLRNYDENRSYRVRLSVSRPDSSPQDGGAVRNSGARTDDSQYEYEATYELAPGAVTTEREIVPAGRYDVSVVGAADPAGGDESDRGTKPVEEATTCNVGDKPPQTIVVEVGNGIVSVTEGIIG